MHPFPTPRKLQKQPPEVFYKKKVYLKFSQKFKGKYLCHIYIFQQNYTTIVIDKVPLFFHDVTIARNPPMKSTLYLFLTNFPLQLTHDVVSKSTMSYRRLRDFETTCCVYFVLIVFGI